MILCVIFLECKNDFVLINYIYHLRLTKTRKKLSLDTETKLYRVYLNGKECENYLILAYLCINLSFKLIN